MKDVAALAGVSLSTVSRAVNGDARVAPELAERVHKAAEMLGYRLDHAASTLRRADRASASLGVIVEDVANPFFSAVHRGIEDVARPRGVMTFTASSDEDGEAERELARAFAARGVDALIVVPAADDHTYLLREREAGLPLVFVDRPPRGIDADCVLTDNTGGMRAATAQLLALGHRRIGFLGDMEQIATARDRLTGYREAHAAAGAELDPSLVRMGLHDETAGQEAAAALLDAAAAPTALVCAQNLIAIGAIHALRARQAQWRVAMIAFDDLPLADMLEPGLTVVAQDPVGLGRRAAELAFARLDGDTSPAQRVVVPATLIRRGSGEVAP